MTVEVAAHRGGSLLAPENTLGAFRQAFARFPDAWIEMDVWPCATGDLVVVHDPTLDRTTSSSGPVSALTPDELAACDAAHRFDGWDFEPVPTLARVLSEGAGAGWKVLLEIKNAPNDPGFDPGGVRHVQALAETLEATGFPLDRLEVICFWPATLDAVKRVDGAIRVGFLTVPDLPGGAPGSGLTALDGARICADRGYEVAGPSCATPDVTADTVDEIHAMGVRLSVWTANTVEEIDRMLEAGVDRITSDRPDLVYERVAALA